MSEPVAQNPPSESPSPAGPPQVRSSSSLVVRFLAWMSQTGLANIAYWIGGIPVHVMSRWWWFRRNRIDVRGFELVPPPGQGFFLLLNHQSMAEGPSVGSVLWPRPIWFPSKAEFYSTPLRAFFFLWMTALHTFPVRRGQRDAAAVGLMEQLLKRGDTVLLFPEGTRSPDGELLPGKVGVGMIIHSAKPLVVPAYVEGFNRLWPPGTPVHKGPKGEHAVIQFGPPMDLSHWWDAPFCKETGRGIVDEVMAEIARLRDMVRAD